jgi:hypothetical protein
MYGISVHHQFEPCVIRTLYCTNLLLFLLGAIIKIGIFLRETIFGKRYVWCPQTRQQSAQKNNLLTIVGECNPSFIPFSLKTTSLQVSQNFS